MRLPESDDVIEEYMPHGHGWIEYGPEGSISLWWGGEIRFPAYSDEHPTCDYVRIVDVHDCELEYWNEDEWSVPSEAGIVMGAILGLAQHGGQK